MDIEAYLSGGIKGLVRSLITNASNSRESAFLLRYDASVRKSSAIRRGYEKRGEHIPPFLIFSVTDECNLRCAGCYAHHNALHSAACGNRALPAFEWGRLFHEAAGLGVSMILLAGGEPLMRRDILELAAKQRGILFPVFTNGTLWDDGYTELFDKHRNLVPMLSVEGNAAETDERRGDGIYSKILSLMNTLKSRGILFGASITVTADNLHTVTDAGFTERLSANGCGVVLYVEYVPVDAAVAALNDSGREELNMRIETLRLSDKKTLYISFPGDEFETGGCLAAGRGFFHINPSGGVEPCPFSPYSDTNIKDIPLIDALKSPLFAKLRASELLNTEHIGGCALFERQEEVGAMV